MVYYSSMPKPVDCDVLRKLQGQILDSRNRYTKAVDEFANSGDTGLMLEIETLRGEYRLRMERAWELLKLITLEKQLEQAREIFGANYFGPEAIKNTFGFAPESIPSIPFSEDQLRRAAELGQRLILRIDRKPDGRPMSMQAMNEILNAKRKWRQRNKVGVLDTAEAPRPGWALVSGDLVLSTIAMDYIQQTEALIGHLKQDVFKDSGEMPEPYKTAINDFGDQKLELMLLVISDPRKAAKRLSNLQITELCRETAAEAVYDLYLQFEATGICPVHDRYIWTGSCAEDGGLVAVGDMDDGGPDGQSMFPGYLDVGFGALLSRRV